MNPLQGMKTTQYIPFSPGSEFPPPASGLPAAAGTSTTGVLSGSTQYRGAISRPAPNVPANATDPNNQPTADPGQQSGGFFAVLQNLMDQLDTMIGQLLGAAATPVPGGGTPGPVPVDGPIAAPPAGAPIAAPATREPL